MSESHEDIRFKVLKKLRESILQAIAHIRANNPQLYTSMQSLLEEYERLVNAGNDIPLIIKNEKIIEGIGRPDVEVFGGRFLIEVKVKESEFQDGFIKLSEYIKFYPYAEYGIITNYDIWNYYKIEKGALTSAHAMNLCGVIEAVFAKGVKVPLSTENVRSMFNPIILLEDELSQVFTANKQNESALFEAYRNIIKVLYEKASEEEIERLFIRHTLMQMIVSASLTVSSGKVTNSTNACSGEDLEIEIVLPYLKWWETLIKKEKSDFAFLSSLSESVLSRALLLDWEKGVKEDIFRELYEILIDAETRRKIGEYYTPLWLAEYMTDRMQKEYDLKGKTVLDPFCGSGTFLVVMFYKKVNDGEDPDKAIKELIGFDINPIAVSVARAELMVAYQNIRKGTVTPLVFNTDSAGLLFKTAGKWKTASFLEELQELEKKIKYVNSPIYASTDVDFSEILKIEVILRQYFKEAARSKDVKEELNNKLSKLGREEWKGLVTALIAKTLADENSIEAIAKLISKYGNGVWAVSITSLFAPHIIQKVKVDVVMTNPPWAQLTEPKGAYGKLLRDKAQELLKGYEKRGQIISGADISSVLLRGCSDIVRHAVAFLMPKEVVYAANSYHGIGKILTYVVAKNYKGEIIEINLDAFQHGRIPSIVLLGKRKGRITCCSMQVEWKGNYSKTLHLFDVKTRIEGKENYKDYIERIMSYTKISSKIIKERLDVDEVVPMGDYIRGLFGGEKKKGAKRYAGLVFDIVGEYDPTTGQYSIKLSGTQSVVRISKYFLDPFWKKVVYRGEIFPFHLNTPYNLLVSSDGQEKLEEFLRNHILGNVSEEDKLKVKLLIDELKQPEKLKLLEDNKNYVVYRCTRNFASFVLADDIREISQSGTHQVIIESHCSFMSTNDEIKAFYYSAILNYLAYKVIREHGAFERDQFLRPLIAMLSAGLQWKKENWQLKIAKLGKALQRKASTCFEGHLRRGMQIEGCFEKLEKCSETCQLFSDLIRIIDENVDQKKLLESLAMVCKLRK